MKPFNAPNPEIIAPTVTSTYAQLPHIALAASAYGAGEAARSAGASAPITPMVLKMYTAATISVPTTVARGMVRVGSSTSSAGTVADSIPRYENRVIDVAARIAENTVG